MAVRHRAMESLEMSVAFAKSFRGKRVLVTGHTGFKGSWLCLWLEKLGAEICGFSLPNPPENSNFVASGIRTGLSKHIEADLRDTQAVKSALKNFVPEIIFHLAAQSLVRESYRTPYETIETNVMGTASVLEAVRLQATPCVVVIATSDKCYENREQDVGYREVDALGGYDPYSASKGAAEIIAASYRRSFFSPEKLEQHGIQVATARAGNVIGGGDWAQDRIVPDLVHALTQSLPVQVRNPTAIRPWQHLLDPLSGYLLLATQMIALRKPELCSAWNFGPYASSDANVQTLVEEFLRVWGSGSWVDARDPKQPHEAGILRLNTEKANTQLNWMPRWSFQETVSRTASWYRNFHSNPSSARKQCLEDIEAHEACG